MLLFLLGTALGGDASLGLALAGGPSTEGLAGSALLTRRLFPAELGVGLHAFHRRVGPRFDAGLVGERGVLRPRVDVVLATLWPTDRKAAVQLFSWLQPGLDLQVAEPLAFTLRGELGGVTRTAEPGWRTAPYAGLSAGIRLRTP